MPAASPPHVDLALVSGIALLAFSNSPGLPIGRKRDFTNEFALLAGVQAARLGRIGQPRMVARA